jgi:hypothetical protein
MNEADARKLWCPFTRVAHLEGMAVNRKAKIDRSPIKDETRCLASDCMAWRWETDAIFNGYCGLAGKPG